MKRGNCYVTSEALFHLLGGYKSPWRPATVRHEGDVHWFLIHKFNPYLILDPTRKQFNKEPPYEDMRRRGFLTKKPSKRAKQLMKTLLYQEVAWKSINQKRKAKNTNS